MPANIQDMNYALKHTAGADKKYEIQIAQLPTAGSLEVLLNKNKVDNKLPTPNELVEKAIKLYEEKGVNIAVGYKETAGEYINLMENTVNQLVNYDCKNLSKHEKEIISDILSNYALAIEKVDKKYKEAERFYKISLELDYNSEATLVNIGLLYFLKLKDYKNAYKIGEKLLKYYPNRKTGKNLIERSLKKLKR